MLSQIDTALQDPPAPPGPEDLLCWLRLAREPGVGPAGAMALVAAAGSPDALYGLPQDRLRHYVSADLARRMAAPPPAALHDELARMLAWRDAAPGRHLLTAHDPAYPAALLTLPDPPLLLHAEGQLPWLQRDGFAIVGARNATTGGLEDARAFAAHLALHGWCVVSGLARGIDAAAHGGALDAGPSCGTVAVLGTGIDRIYPAAHAGLAARIRAQGALVSELPLGTPPLAHHFPRRNRLVAGLARGVLVVEAAPHSGSLGTARLGADYGREVFAMPGSIHSPLSRGCHALIREGAKLVETAADILEELGPSGAPPWRRACAAPGGAMATMPPAMPPMPATPAADRIPLSAAVRGTRDTAVAPAGTVAASGQAIMRALGYDAAHLDVLVSRTGLDAATVQACLVDLEFGGLVVRESGGRFRRRSGGAPAF